MEKYKLWFLTGESIRTLKKESSEIQYLNRAIALTRDPEVASRWKNRVDSIGERSFYSIHSK